MIYTQKEGESERPIKDYLGELTNELVERDWITKSVCNGPENFEIPTRENSLQGGWIFPQ